MSRERPVASIVIPIYNEQEILRTAVEKMVRELDAPPADFDYEILLCENGSKDKTPEIGADLAREYPTVRLLRCPAPDYGEALRLGILEARGEYVLCDEIDLCDVEFHRRALRMLRTSGAEMVIGSKALGESHDNRPPMRRFATKMLNGLLWVAVGFTGTDTHGLKTFNRAKLLDIVHACELRKDLFASELVIRASRARLDVREIPIDLHEIRPPSISLYKRVPKVLKDLLRLIYLIRFKSGRILPPARRPTDPKDNP